MQESIYNLIPPERAVLEKSAMYRSKHNGGSLAPSFSTFGFHGSSKVVGNVAGDIENFEGCHASVKPHATFGRSVGPEVSPRKFLKATSHRDRSPSAERNYEKKHQARHPPVPNRVDKPVMGLTTDKNFVVANAVEAVLATSKKAATVEDRPMEKATFAQVPKYIQTIKAELHASNAQKAADAAADHSHLRELAEPEIQELRSGLQQRWDYLNKQFSTMSFNLETRSQLRRKEQLEAELRKIEQAMQRLSKKRVYVKEDE